MLFLKENLIKFQVFEVVVFLQFTTSKWIYTDSEQYNIAVMKRNIIMTMNIKTKHHYGSSPFENRKNTNKKLVMFLRMMRFHYKMCNFYCHGYIRRTTFIEVHCSVVNYYILGPFNEMCSNIQVSHNVDLHCITAWKKRIFFLNSFEILL